MAESTKITFEAAANTAGAGEFFKTLAEFWDKQISKGILGQTMTADDGASKSQAVVHNEVRLDILEADAKALSKTLQAQVVKPFLDLNHGPSDRYPKITLVVPKPEDIKALVDALSKLVPLGLKVEQSVIRDKLGIPDPAKDAELLGVPTPVPATPPGTAANRARNAEGGGDPFAADQVAQRLAEESSAAHRDLLDRIKGIVDGAESMEALRDQLLEAFADLPTDDLGKVMQAGFSVANLLGRFDASREARV
jgi:phage gp29-like protein